MLREKIQDLRREKIATSQAEIDKQQQVIDQQLAKLKLKTGGAAAQKTEENENNQEEYPTYRVNLRQVELNLSVQSFVNAFLSIYLEENKGEDGKVIYNFRRANKYKDDGLMGALKKICKDDISYHDLKKIIDRNNFQCLVNHLNDDMKPNFLKMIEDLKICESHFNNPSNVEKIFLFHPIGHSKGPKLSNKEAHHLVNHRKTSKDGEIEGGSGLIEYKNGFLELKLKGGTFSIPDPQSVMGNKVIEYGVAMTYKVNDTGIIDLIDTDSRILEILKKLMTVKIEIKE